MEVFDLEKVAEMNGQDGKPVWIVYQGKVYDVSGSKLWKNGVHMRIHQAGGDLSDHLPKAPHGPETLERYPQIGTIKTVKEEAPEAGTVQTFAILERYPFLRRHPHPMVVHFPIAFVIAATAFYILYLLSGIPSLETTSLHCLAAGLLFVPVGMGTGYLTWYLNYESSPIRAVRIKIVLSWLLLLLSAVALAWRILDPRIIYASSRYGYGLLLILLTLLVSTIGWYGGQLTIPKDK